jgi:hypothetical protein
MKLVKIVPVPTYDVVNDDGSEIDPATKQIVKDVVKLMKDAKVLGNASPVNNNVAMRIASTILSNYSLRKNE